MMTYSPTGISKVSNFDHWSSGKVKRSVTAVLLATCSFCKINPSLAISSYSSDNN